MAELIVEGLSVSAGSMTLVRDAALTVRPGEFVALLGPNGAGKTTLVRAAIGLRQVDRGIATIDKRDTAGLSVTERARQISYLPQQRSLAWPLKVRDVVALGRYSHGLRGTRPSSQDQAAIDRALRATDLHGLADRRSNTLSGGELARVHCARALCTEAPLIVADEPTAALDLKHAFELMDVLQAFVEGGGSTLVIVHDLVLAARYASHLVWMKSGEIVAQGPVEGTLTKELCAEVYGVHATIEGRNLSIDGLL